jgi:hypothetical protein
MNLDRQAGDFKNYDKTYRARILFDGFTPFHDTLSVHSQAFSSPATFGNRAAAGNISCP